IGHREAPDTFAYLCTSVMREPHLRRVLAPVQRLPQGAEFARGRLYEGGLQQRPPCRREHLLFVPRRGPVREPLRCAEGGEVVAVPPPLLGHNGEEPPEQTRHLC